jgi:uncharacterized membrane protein
VLDEITGANLVSIGWFLGAWIGYGVVIEHSRLGRRSLNARMDAFRKVWMRRMLERELRIVDTTIMATLQNGTAFFASTALIALGGALSFLRAPEETLRLVADLPFAAPTSRGLWEAKVVGLAIILAYAFFKFAWSYRLMNYAAILLGATPNVFDADDGEALRMADRAAAMNTVAGGHFNRGQRALFFALGYMGWFMGPLVFMLTTASVLAVMAARQLRSDALRALEVHG